MTRQALIVIDVQESFRHRPYWHEADLPLFLANLSLLIGRAHAAGIPVVQVFHREAGDDPADPFSAASGLVRELPELVVRPTAVFYKQVHSAMFARNGDGSNLESWLFAQGIEELLITGIRTEQCCETTTRHASDLGFKVQYISDATLTFPMRTRSGREVSAAEIHERAELVLEGRFARIVTAAEALLLQ
jgi:nicotinamidase-related amidase